MCKAWIDQKEAGIKEGKEQGIKEGIEEGKKQGIKEGKAEDILDLLTDIGTVAADLKTKILSETNLDILKRWLKLAAKSDSIEAFTSAM